MKSRKLHHYLLALIIAAGAFAAGCELIVDFDRSKIPVDVDDADVGGPDQEPVEAGDQDAMDDAAEGADIDASDAGDEDDAGDEGDAEAGT